MRILFTADLHLLRTVREAILRKVRDWISDLRPDCLVIAGDIAVASQAEEVLSEIRRSVSGIPIAISLGNHDFWLEEVARRDCGVLSAVIERYWVPAARLADIVLLDRENFQIGGVTIVGGYGHYDLGFAVPGLSYRGATVTEADYQRGYPYPESALRWRDFQLMPGTPDPKSVASDQVWNVMRRIDEAKNSPLIVVLHTPPFEELLGIPTLAEADPGSPPSEYAFFRAYLGNRSMGNALKSVNGKILAVVCGHTHRSAGPVSMHNTVGINIGSDYAQPKAAIYSSETMLLERVPDS